MNGPRHPIDREDAASTTVATNSERSSRKQVKADAYECVEMVNGVTSLYDLEQPCPFNRKSHDGVDTRASDTPTYVSIDTDGDVTIDGGISTTDTKAETMASDDDSKQAASSDVSPPTLVSSTIGDDVMEKNRPIEHLYSQVVRSNKKTEKAQKQTENETKRHSAEPTYDNATPADASVASNHTEHSEQVVETADDTRHTNSAADNSDLETADELVLNDIYEKYDDATPQ